MNGHASDEALEAIALGEPAAGAREHVHGCPGCGRRLAWMEAEGDLVRRWAMLRAGDAGTLVAGVDATIARRARRGRTARAAMALGAACAAAAALALLVPWTRGAGEAVPATSAGAIARAEQDYARAIEILEARLEERRRPDTDTALARARAGLQRSRMRATRDPAVRVRLLEGYAMYLKSLRRALRDAEAP